MHVPGDKEVFTFAFDNNVLVDQVKSYLFRHIPSLAGKNHNEYWLCLDEGLSKSMYSSRFLHTCK